MGRTFDLLTRGRTPRPVLPEGERSVIPMPSLPSAEPDDEPVNVELVPLSEDDLPSDDDSKPFIEVGGPRSARPLSPTKLDSANSNTAAISPTKVDAVPSHVDARSSVNTLPDTLGSGGPTAAINVPSPTLQAPRSIESTGLTQVDFQLLPNLGLLDVTARRIGPEIVAYHRPEHPVSRQYRALVDAMNGQLPTDRCAVLLFAPTSSRSGCTTAALNAAVTRANDGHGRVLVVEVERTADSAAARLGVPAVPGLRELLNRSVPMTTALHRTGMEGVFVIPSGRCEVGTDQLLRIPSLLDQFRVKFDWIIVDAPHWGTRPLIDFAKSADGVYLVMRQDEWDSPSTDAAHEGLAGLGAKVRGCITTRE